MIRKIVVGLVALTFGSLAFASGDTFVQPPVITNTYSPGIYIGAQAGYGMTNWTNVEQTAGNSTLAAKTDVSGSSAFAGRLFVGYDFHPNFAIEAGYTQFFNNTKINTSATANFPFIGPVSTTATTNPKYTYIIDLVGKLKAHIVDNFGLYAKAGVDYIHVSSDLSATINGVAIPVKDSSQTESAFNVVYGAGAYYDITPNLTADLSWTRFNGDPKLSNDYIPAHDLFALGASWKFNFA